MYVTYNWIGLLEDTKLSEIVLVKYVKSAPLLMSIISHSAGI